MVAANSGHSPAARDLMAQLQQQSALWEMTTLPNYYTVHDGPFECYGCRSGCHHSDPSSRIKNRGLRGQSLRFVVPDSCTPCFFCCAEEINDSLRPELGSTDDV